MIDNQWIVETPLLPWLGIGMQVLVHTSAEMLLALMVGPKRKRFCFSPVVGSQLGSRRRKPISPQTASLPPLTSCQQILRGSCPIYGTALDTTGRTGMEKNSDSLNPQSNMGRRAGERIDTASRVRHDSPQRTALGRLHIRFRCSGINAAR